MGTRAIYGFRKNGKEKVTYCHQDGYPEGLGILLTKFIMATSTHEMKVMFENITLVNPNSEPTQENIDICKPFIDLNVSTEKTLDWYCLLYHLQGDLSPYRKGFPYMLDGSMVSHFHYKYLIDLDKEVFIVIGPSKDELIRIPFNQLNIHWVQQLY